jgi:hypothetical protein
MGGGSKIASGSSRLYSGQCSPTPENASRLERRLRIPWRGSSSRTRFDASPTRTATPSPSAPHAPLRIEPAGLLLSTRGPARRGGQERPVRPTPPFRLPGVRRVLVERSPLRSRRVGERPCDRRDRRPSERKGGLSPPSPRAERGIGRWGLHRSLLTVALTRAKSARECCPAAFAGRCPVAFHQTLALPTNKSRRRAGAGGRSGRGPLRVRPRGVYRANSPDGAAGEPPRELRTSPDNLLMDGPDNRKAGRREGRSGQALALGRRRILGHRCPEWRNRRSGPGLGV